MPEAHTWSRDPRVIELHTQLTQIRFRPRSSLPTEILACARRGLAWGDELPPRRTLPRLLLPLVVVVLGLLLFLLWRTVLRTTRPHGQGRALVSSVG